MTNSSFVKKYEEPLLLVSTFVFTLCYATQIIFTPAGLLYSLLELGVNISWIIFALDYAFNLICAKQKIPWILRHIPELLIVAIPTLRAFRLLRLLSLFAIIQKVGGNRLRGKVITYVTGSTIMVVLISSLAILDTERGISGSHINNFGDALWWVFVTITTVGYGDLVPVTTLGRIIAVLLMISGIALLGTVTATLASWIVEQVNTETAKESDEVLKRVEKELAELKDLILDTKESPEKS